MVNAVVSYLTIVLGGPQENCDRDITLRKKSWPFHTGLKL